MIPKMNVECCSNAVVAVGKGHPDCLKQHFSATTKVVDLVYELFNYLVEETPEVNAGKLACFKYLYPIYRSKRVAEKLPDRLDIGLYQFVHRLEPCVLLQYAHELGGYGWTCREGFEQFIDACYKKRAPAALLAATKLGYPLLWDDGTVSRPDRPWRSPSSNISDMIRVSTYCKFYCEEMIGCMVALGAPWNPAGKDLLTALKTMEWDSRVVSWTGGYYIVEHLLSLGCPIPDSDELSERLDACFEHNPPDDLMKYPLIRNLLLGNVAASSVLLRHDGKILKTVPFKWIARELEKIKKVLDETKVAVEKETGLPNDVVEHVLMHYL